MQACVEQGTHYCDLTVELPFIQWNIERHHEAAAAKGVRTATSCCKELRLSTMVLSATGITGEADAFAASRHTGRVVLLCLATSHNEMLADSRSALITDADRL